MKLVIVTLLILATATGLAFGKEHKMTNDDYVNQWSTIAVEQMNQYGIPASITMAQGILESGSGNSMLAKKANNHFGIKCHGWKGEKIYHDDDEDQEEDFGLNMSEDE